MDYIIVGIVAYIAAVGSTIAGGGGGLVTTPLMLLLGFPPQTALASTKASGLGINIGSLSKFAQQKGVVRWRWAALLSVLAVIASIIGTNIVFVFDAETLKNIVGVTTVALVPITYFSKDLGLENKKTSKLKEGAGTGLYFAVMILQAGIGSGTGLFLIFILMGFMGFDALSASATKRVSSLVIAVVSFSIFAASGYIDYKLAAALGIGMLLGGYTGAHIALKHGNELVKKALLTVSFIMGISVLIR